MVTFDQFLITRLDFRTSGVLAEAQRFHGPGLKLLQLALALRLAVALAGNGIRVNAVAIGSVMSASLREFLRENREMRDTVTRATPLGWIGEADEVVGAVQYLASEAASFVTGQIVTVDGGRSLLDPAAIAAH